MNTDEGRIETVGDILRAAVKTDDPHGYVTKKIHDSLGRLAESGKALHDTVEPLMGTVHDWCADRVKGRFIHDLHYHQIIIQVETVKVDCLRHWLHGNPLWRKRYPLK